MLYGDIDELVALLSLFSTEELKKEWNELFPKGTVYKKEGEFVAAFLFGEKVRL